MASFAGLRREEGSLPTVYFSMLWAPQFTSKEDEQSRVVAKRQKLDVESYSFHGHLLVSERAPALGGSLGVTDE